MVLRLHDCRLLTFGRLVAGVSCSILWPACLDYAISMLDCKWMDISSGGQAYHLHFPEHSAYCKYVTAMLIAVEPLLTCTGCIDGAVTVCLVAPQGKQHSKLPQKYGCRLLACLSACMTLLTGHGDSWCILDAAQTRFCMETLPSLSVCRLPCYATSAAHDGGCFLRSCGCPVHTIAGKQCWECSAEQNTGATNAATGCWLVHVRATVASSLR